MTLFEWVLISVLIIHMIGVYIMAGNFSALNAAVTKLNADVTTLIQAQQSDQPSIDAVTAAVTAIDNAVVAATPTTPATPVAGS
jgi:hypothetical protein